MLLCGNNNNIEKTFTFEIMNINALCHDHNNAIDVKNYSNPEAKMEPRRLWVQPRRQDQSFTERLTVDGIAKQRFRDRRSPWISLGDEQLDRPNNQTYIGQWLWLSWQSGRFQYQKFAVRIQSSPKMYIFIEHLFTVNCVLKRRK